MFYTKFTKKVILSVLYAIKDTWYRKMVKFNKKVGLTKFPVQVYFTNLVGMFEIRVIPVLCSIILKKTEKTSNYSLTLYAAEFGFVTISSRITRKFVHRYNPSLP